jgi:hypothetical protein
MTEQRLVTTYLGPDLLERCESWGLLSVALGVAVFLSCLGVWLFLKPEPPKEIVKVETPPAQVVRVEVPTPAPAPPPVDINKYIPKGEPPKTSAGEPIKRDVTVFSSVEHDGGQIVTGWRFKDGAAGSPPLGQYCYYATAATIAGQAQTRVDIADDGIAIDAAQNNVPNFASAVTKCQWYDGSPTKTITPLSANRVTTVPTATEPQPLIAPETVAVDYVKSFVDHWSDPATPLETIAAYYAESVFYFGKQTPHEAIVTDIAHNAGRWPYRRYSISNNQISAECGASGKYVTPKSDDFVVCDVIATLEWHVANEQRKAGGFTQTFYELSVQRVTGRSEIFAHTENVISRHAE